MSVQTYDVGYPLLVGCGGLEILFQLIGRHRQAVMVMGRSLVSFRGLGPQILDPHDVFSPIVAAGLVVFVLEPLGDPGRSGSDLILQGLRA